MVFNYMSEQKLPKKLCEFCLKFSLRDLEQCILCEERMCENCYDAILEFDLENKYCLCCIEKHKNGLYRKIKKAEVDELNKYYDKVNIENYKTCFPPLAPPFPKVEEQK